MYRLRSDGSLKTQGEIRQAHPNTSYPKIWTVSTCNDLDIDPVLITPKPVASSDLKIVIRDGVIQDQLSNWVEAWTEVDRFHDILPDGPTKAEQDAAYLAQLIVDSRERIQTENKAECKDLIYTSYNQEFQNNIGLGLIPEATATTAATWIFNMREEENRVFDLLEASDDPESVETPTWPEV